MWCDVVQGVWCVVWCKVWCGVVWCIVGGIVVSYRRRIERPARQRAVLSGNEASCQDLGSLADSVIDEPLVGLQLSRTLAERERGGGREGGREGGRGEEGGRS